MKTIRRIFILVALAGTSTVYAQTKPEKPLLERPYIEVTGTAEREIIPDEIYIGIVIKERTEGKTKVTIEEQEEKLRNAIKELGIPVSNLSLSDANADYVRIRKTKDVLTKKDYVLKVSSATLLSQVYQQLEKMEISEANIIRVSHSRIDSIRKEVRVMAIKAAKEKADYLLIAIKEQTGKALFVIEQHPTLIADELLNRTNRALTNNQNDEVFKSLDRKDEVQFKKIRVSYQIFVRFEIR